jgi:hypothetical protein
MSRSCWLDRCDREPARTDRLRGRQRDGRRARPALYARWRAGGRRDSHDGRAAGGPTLAALTARQRLRPCWARPPSGCRESSRASPGCPGDRACRQGGRFPGQAPGTRDTNERHRTGLPGWGGSSPEAPPDPELPGRKSHAGNSTPGSPSCQTNSICTRSAGTDTGQPFLVRRACSPHDHCWTTSERHALTDLGRSLWPAIEGFADWAAAHA